jgi:ribosomal protein L40E
VAGLLDEAGIGRSAPHNVCPGCGTTMPPGAIVCIQCGYNQRLGRKMETQVGPSAPAPADAALGARLAARRGKARAFSLVAKGVTLLYWAVLLQCAAVVALVASVWLLPALRVSAALRVILVAALVAILVGSLMQIAGRILCLFVPRQSRARGLIVASVLLELVNILLNILFNLPGDLLNLPPQSYLVLELAGRLSWFAAMLVFFWFFKRLGRYLKRPEVADEAQWLINASLGLGACLLIVVFGRAFLFYYLVRLGPGGLPCLLVPLQFVLGLVLIGVIIYMLIRYLRLLTSLHHALLRASEE